MSNSKISFKEESRKSYGPKTERSLTPEELQLGCSMRIADAVELIAKDRVRMEHDLAWYKKKYQECQEEIATLTRSRNTFKGKYHSLKSKLEQLEKEACS